MTDYKQLCAELYSIFEKYDDESNLGGIYRDMEADGVDILDRVRAALAEPEPEGPTDEKLTLTYSLAVAAAVDGTSKPWPADLCERAQLAGLRAVLARWGSNNTSRSN